MGSLLRCTYKGLNAFKAGCAAFETWWKSQGMDGPILLMNLANAAANGAGASTEAGRHAAKLLSKGGAVKAISINCRRDI
jgi:hypothetical protein